MKNTYYAFLAAFLLVLSSCGGGESEVKLGEVFQVNDWEMSIDAVSSAGILASEAEKAVLVAPEGKTYLKVRMMCNASDHVMGVFVGEEKLEEVDFMDVMDFVSEDADIDAKYCESFYMIDAGQKIDRIEVRGFGKGSARFILKDVTYTDATDRKLHPKMRDFLNEFSSSQRLLDVVRKYTSQDVYNIVRENGMDVPANPLVSNVRIHYMDQAGNQYACYGDALGMLSMDLTWSGDEISSLQFSN